MTIAKIINLDDGHDDDEYLAKQSQIYTFIVNDATFSKGKDIIFIELLLML